MELHESVRVRLFLWYTVGRFSCVMFFRVSLTKKTTYIPLFILLICIGGFFASPVSAEVCNCMNPAGAGYDPVARTNAEDSDTCKQFCIDEDAKAFSFNNGSIFSIDGSFIGKVGNAVLWTVDPFVSIGSSLIKGGLTSLAEGFLTVINIVLYALLAFISVLLTAATAIFGWATDASMFQHLFNLQSVYSLWGMIRDFFNLFFILTLLFIAFCTIFQIQAYNYKKWLLNLVLMALLTNFSFPVTRFLIDATNVPMYFFVQSMFDTSSQSTSSASTGAVEVFLSSGKIKEAVIPPLDKITSTMPHELTLKLVQAIVVLFLFASSLLVLAIMFLVRVIMLLVLTIFSPVGFAGSAIPGLNKFASQWWDNLFKYALFGPSAMLLLLVAVVFLREFKVDGKVAGDLNVVTSSLTASQSGSNLVEMFVVMFIPVIFIWIAINVGQKTGLAGADVAKKYGMMAMNKASGLDWTKRRWGSFKGEWDKRSKARYEANNAGSRLGRSTTLAADKVTSGKYFPGSKVSKNLSMSSIDTAQQARVKEEAERNRINDRTSDAELLRQRDEARKKGDKSHFVAVVQEMRNRDSLQGEIERSDMESIEKHFKSRGDVTNAVFAETQQKVAEKNLHAAYGDNVSEMTKALKTGKVKMEDQTANALTDKVLQAGLESNKIDQKVLDELSKDGEKGANITANIQAAMNAYEADFTGRHAAARSTDEKKALEKQRVAAHQAFLSHTGDFHAGALLATQNDVFKKADKTTFKRMSATAMDSYMPQVIQFTPSRKVVNIVSDLAEEDKTKAVSFISAIKNERSRGSMDANDTIDRLKDDHRTRKVTTYI